jgi:hypothetical protein
MWWERLGVAPIRPQDADDSWHSAELTVKSVSLLERAVKASGGAGAVGWWVTPWENTPKGPQATLTVYFAKRTHAKNFQANPPISQKR